MTKIAILGFGVVGSGTVEVFYKNKENLEMKTGLELDIGYILDIRDFPESPYKEKFTKNFDDILLDDEVKVVAEFIGGNKAAYDFVKRSLESGKSVVTSNKELVATKGAELLQIAAEKGVNFFFEASVGGGIPIIRPLHMCLATDEIKEINGILNGTTNFILTKMKNEDMPFSEALKIAQELGYAESNPEADVEGHDTCRKICILASLAFGKHIYPEYVKTEGITKITKEDMQYTDIFGGAIKLIGFAKKSEEGGKTEILTAPFIIPNDSQLAGVNDVFNAILVSGDSTGEVLFYGKGAGKYPTASAVVSDIINALKMDKTSRSLTWEDSDKEKTDEFIEKAENLVHRFYIRVKLGDTSVIKSIYGDKDIKYLYRDNAPEGELAFITNKMPHHMFIEKCDKLSKTTEILGTIRVL